MNQKKLEELQIGKESRSLSSDLINPIQPPIHPKHLHIQTQNQSFTPQKHQNHLQIQVLSHSSSQSLPRCATSTPSSPTHQIFKQTQFRNEPICDNPSASKTHLSSPQKRPIMSQNLSHSPTLSSLHHHRSATGLNSERSRPSVLCLASFSVVALATKTIALSVSRYLCCIRWVGVHLRFIILLSLPSLYFFTSNHGNTFFLHFLAVLAVSATLVISLNLALPRFPSIRSLIARSFPIKLSSSATSGAAAFKSRPPVVWSIGSKTKSEKGPHSGSWVQVYSNGDVYEGEFHKGKCSGSGVYSYSMSGRYEGDWVDGKYDGFGVETWAKGSRYRGQYRLGLRNGFGVYRFYTGDVYAGEWCNGQCHGCGVYTCKDGSQYVGEFRQGVKHGLGHYSFRNGDKYAGEYFADKMHGFGVYHFANGHRYEGAWHEGKRQGVGMYTFRNGDTQSGHWQNGVLNVLSVQGILPGSSFAVNHSKVLNAVQEAHHAAGKAADGMGKVDERVNKAVAAANRSANAARVAAVKAVQNQIHHDNSSGDVPIQLV